MAVSHLSQDKLKAAGVAPYSRFRTGEGSVQRHEYEIYNNHLSNPLDRSGWRLTLTSTAIAPLRDGNVSRDVGAGVEDSADRDVTPSWTDGELCLGLSTVPPPTPLFAILWPLERITSDEQVGSRAENTLKTKASISRKGACMTSQVFTENSRIVYWCPEQCELTAARVGQLHYFPPHIQSHQWIWWKHMKTEWINLLSNTQANY